MLMFLILGVIWCRNIEEKSKDWRLRGYYFERKRERKFERKMELNGNGFT